MKYIQLNEDIKTKAQIEKFLYKELNDYFVVNQKEIKRVVEAVVQQSCDSLFSSIRLGREC